MPTNQVKLHRSNDVPILAISFSLVTGAVWVLPLFITRTVFLYPEQKNVSKRMLCEPNESEMKVMLQKQWR